MAILDLPTYKSYKGITSTTDDTSNTLIIDAVNAFVEGYTGRVFTTYYDTDKVEYFESDELALYPTEHPIVGITSLEYSSDNGQTHGTALVEFTDYVIDSSYETIIPINNTFADLAFVVNGLKLTYKGGYSVIPKDLEMAAVHLADHYRDEEYIPRKSMAGVSVDTVIQPDMTARVPAHIRRVLESYRNIVF